MIELSESNTDTISDLEVWVNFEKTTDYLYNDGIITFPMPVPVVKLRGIKAFLLRLIGSILKNKHIYNKGMLSSVVVIYTTDDIIPKSNVDRVDFV